MSLDRLMRAADALEGSPEGDYLATAVRRLVAGLGADQALELCGPGAQRERDRLLTQAGMLAAPHATTWQKAGALEALIQAQPRRHRARVLNDAEVLIDAAARCARLPETRRRLYDILRAGLERPPAEINPAEISNEAA